MNENQKVVGQEMLELKNQFGEFLRKKSAYCTKIYQRWQLKLFFYKFFVVILCRKVVKRGTKMKNFCILVIAFRPLK